MSIKEISTKAFDGQKPGTSGLRKRYVDNADDRDTRADRGRVVQREGVPAGGTRPRDVTEIYARN
jgi:hypothetical protein